jgi:prophage regulatory protein
MQPQTPEGIQFKEAIRLIELQSRLLTKKERAMLDGSQREPVPERLLRLPEVLKRTGLSKKTIYRFEAAGRFPLRRQLGPRAVGWPESEVNAWIANSPGWRCPRKEIGK